MYTVDLKDGRLQIVTESMKWPDMPIRRASINSFGYGGANAHAIIESVDSVLPGYRSSHQASIFMNQSTPSAGINGINHGLTSTHANGRLNGQSNGYTNGRTNGSSEDHVIWPRRTQFLLPFSAHDEKTLQRNFAALRGTSSNWDLADIAYTLSERRSMLTYRAFVVAGVGKTSEAFWAEKLAVTKKQATALPVTGFVFTGLSSHPQI